MLSEKLLVSESKRRAHIFNNLDKYLRIIVDTVKMLDKDAEVYLFGSVADGRYLLSSDIDILLVTEMPPGKVIAELWKSVITDPFEIHVITKNAYELYRRRAKLIRLTSSPQETQHS